MTGQNRLESSSEHSCKNQLVTTETFGDFLREFFYFKTTHPCRFSLVEQVGNVGSNHLYVEVAASATAISDMQTAF